MEPNDTASYWDGVRAQAEILIDLLQHGEHTSDAPFHDTSLNYPFVPTPDPTNHTSAHAHQTLSGHSSSTASRFGIANNGQQLDQHNGLHTAADFGASEFERVHTMLALQRDLPEAQLEDDRGGLQEWYGMTPTPDSKPFNIFHALDLVATRSNPQISSDATQARRSFVVMDTWQFDMPIIYVSDNFLHLTGYTHQDTIAQNCRFLQSPDGRVQPNVPRDHISSLEAYQLKQGLFRYAEFRQTIGNFRKNGEPFINLLTIIPISWDTDGTRFFFGFQLDVTRDLFGPELIRLGNGSQDSIVSRRKQKVCHKHIYIVHDKSREY